MVGKWSVLSLVTAVSVALLAAGISLAEDDKEGTPTPIKKNMKQIDSAYKSIVAAAKTRVSFKRAANGKDVAAAAKKLVTLGKETRKYGDEPAKNMKKPIDKWVDMAERFVVAAEETASAAEKGDFVATGKARSTLTTACSNCHGAFRPEVGDGF
jgi:cytochrome c556